MRSLNLFINNFSFVNDLLKSEKHTKGQKIDLIRKFDNIKNLNDSKNLYKKLKENGKERN